MCFLLNYYYNTCLYSSVATMKKKYQHDFLVNNITHRLHWLMTCACACGKLSTIFFTQQSHKLIITYNYNAHVYTTRSEALSKLPIFNSLKKVDIESNLNNTSDSITEAHNIRNQCQHSTVWSSKYYKYVLGIIQKIQIIGTLILTLSVTYVKFDHTIEVFLNFFKYLCNCCNTITAGWL